MNWVFFVDTVSLLAILAALPALWRGRGRVLRRDAWWLLLGLLALTLFHDVSNVLEWSGITAALDIYEDYSGLLLPVVWFFVAYALLRDRAAKALRESEERYRAVAEDTPVMICRFLPGGEITYANDACCKYFEKTSDELVGSSFLSLIPGADREIVMANFSALTVESPTQPHEHPVIAPDGEIRWQRWTNRAIFDAQAQAVAYQSIGEDITERKRVEEALRNSEERLRQIAETIDDVFWITDWENHKTLFASRAYERVWGRSLEDLYADAGNWADAIHPEDRERAWESFVKLGEGDSYDEVYRIARPDGSMRWIRDRGFPVRDVRGQVYRVAGIAQDITERKRAEVERERLMSAIEQAAEAVMITDDDGTIQYVNPAFERITGYTRQEAIGRNPRILKSGEHDDAFYKEMWGTLARGETWSGRLVNKKKDGTRYTEEATISPVRDASGEMVNYVAVKRDVTKEVALQVQLRQAQKLEAVGQLAAGVAHDFNNILTAILGNAELLHGALAAERPPNDALLEDVTQITRSAKRAAGLTRQLLTFSRRQVVQPAVLDLNQILLDLERMLKRLITEDIRLTLHLSDGLGRIRADAGQIEQVITNLVVNARDAMPTGGTLIVETTDVALDEAYLADHGRTGRGPHVLLSVGDTGCGMDSATLEHIFEPFFTTKEVGRGTGLGLATVHGIVEQAGGHVRVYSEPGKGTTFKVYLPAVDAPIEQGAAAVSDVALHGTETVLVCEDNEPLRRIAERFLRDAGYTVLVAESGPDLLALVADRDEPIDLLVTDVVMPGMNGRQLAERLAISRPRMRVLYMSGHTSGIIADHGVLSEGVEFLEKPFNRHGLLCRVREVLDRQRKDTNAQ